MEVANVNEKPLPFVTSLPVENVQSLAASTNLSTIPERYVRPEIDNYPLQDGDCEDEVPVVDMHKLFNLQHSLGEAAKLVHACEEWGFFQHMQSYSTIIHREMDANYTVTGVIYWRV